MKREMKTIIGTIVAAAVGLALTGCGSSSGAKTSKTTFTAPTATTISNVKTGATVFCKNKGVQAKAKVPSPGHGTGVSADGTSSSASLQLTRHSDGSLAVSCSR